MDMTSFWTEAEERIKKYDLLTHSFYVAWSKGELTNSDLQNYSMQYYKHVEEFPEYLATLEKRLPDSELRSCVKENRQDELGSKSADHQAHSDMWLDFADGLGADRVASKNFIPNSQVQELIAHFQNIAAKGSTAEALAAFYAYESQVPQIAYEKAKWLKELYGADARTCRYFSVHAVADIEHAHTWRHLIDREISGNKEKEKRL